MQSGSFLSQNSSAFTNCSCSTATQAEKVKKTTLATITLIRPESTQTEV